MTTLARRIKASSLSHDAQLVKMARVVGRLENKQRKLRRELKDVAKELRIKRRELKGYAQSIGELKQTPPFRMYGEQ